MLFARETGGAKRCRSRGADPSRSPRTTTGWSLEGDRTLGLSHPLRGRQEGGWRRSRGSWGYACAARWRRACRLGGGGEDGGVIGRKRERGCADGASRLALRCADADDARMTWMIRRTSPRLSRSVNAPLASRYRSSALGARHSALQTGFPPRIGVGMPFTPLEIAIAVDSGCLARPLPMALFPLPAPATSIRLAGLLDGAVSDQAPGAVCSPNWGPS
ncbi:hypothetical protein B0H13DRAFT_589537 [Mycena leptocephala]|nr:hypothetical protein B0H13DRAFT_589537 [Mycena leptocephala]